MGNYMKIDKQQFTTPSITTIDSLSLNGNETESFSDIFISFCNNVELNNDTNNSDDSFSDKLKKLFNLLDKNNFLNGSQIEINQNQINHKKIDYVKIKN
ncbi:hypothetical protein PL321_16260 [Caloramator sp. mosi_1]|uniref:hypothetical protein n=1 Tax=Caloramator sp. mosi_1 TaxID=3023090 RepID=UPI0023629EA4|nr:hypothetical protein [Caloramator sp. mosi_1]WDC83937.1 hypothetical protein PL321_16260 [Caloramator sp. mosi_1]